MQNSGPSNNRAFGNRSFNSNGGNQNNIGNPFQNDGFDQNNQNSDGNFYDDFDLNAFSKNINQFDRSGNNRLNFNAIQDFDGNDNNFANSNWKGHNQFNQRGGNNSFGSTNDHFNSGNNNRNFQNNEDTRSGQHCIHMRGLPYYTDEMDVFNVSLNEIRAIAWIEIKNVCLYVLFLFFSFSHHSNQASAKSSSTKMECTAAKPKLISIHMI